MNVLIILFFFWHLVLSCSRALSLSGYFWYRDPLAMCPLCWGRVEGGNGGYPLGWWLVGRCEHAKQAKLTASQLLQVFSQPIVRATMFSLRLRSMTMPGVAFDSHRSDAAQFPVFVVLIAHCLAMKAIEMHEDLRQQRILVEYVACHGPSCSWALRGFLSFIQIRWWLIK